MKHMKPQVAAVIGLLFLHPMVFGQRMAPAVEQGPTELEMLKYRLELRSSQLKDVQQGTTIRSRAAQELAKLKPAAKRAGAMALFKKQAGEALQSVLQDPDKVVADEARLALKKISDERPYDKVAKGENWLQVMDVERGGETLWRIDSDKVVLEVSFRTNHSAVTFETLSQKAEQQCYVTYAGGEQAHAASGGGGDFQDPKGQKMCVFSIPAEARSVRFRLLDLPETDLRF